MDDDIETSNSEGFDALKGQVSRERGDCLMG